MSKKYARARQGLVDGCPLGQSLMALLHEIARMYRHTARGLMTGAQQISLCLRAVFVSAQRLFGTDVVGRGPTRGLRNVVSKGMIWGMEQLI